MYEIRVYNTQEAFHKREYSILTEEIRTKREALRKGRALAKTWAVVKIQSDDRGFIKVLGEENW